jgi:hypothetical protein
MPSRRDLRWSVAGEKPVDHGAPLLMALERTRAARLRYRHHFPSAGTKTSLGIVSR